MHAHTLSRNTQLELDLIALANGFALAHLPKMPELKGVDASGFDSSVDPNAIPYKDKGREKERLRKMSEPRVPRPPKERRPPKEGKRPAKKIKKPQKKRKFYASLDTCITILTNLTVAWGPHGGMGTSQWHGDLTVAWGPHSGMGTSQWRGDLTVAWGPHSGMGTSQWHGDLTVAWGQFQY